MNLEIPTALNNFNIYTGESGNVFAGMGDLELPEIKMLTAALNVAGTGGELEVPLIGHTAAMQCTINAPVATIEALQAAVPVSQMITARGSQQVFDPSVGVNRHQPICIVMRGPLDSLKLGTWKKGQTEDTSHSFQLDYIKVSIDNEEYLEIDKWNNIFRVNGVDYSSEVRENI
jgi:P2 family phage contractile tail tube protein